MLLALRLPLVLSSVLLSLWISGCARGPTGALTALAPGQLEARVALAQPIPPQVDPVDHAMALAEAERSLARPDRAAAAVGLALGRAEAAWWTARLRGDAAATKQTRARLDQVAKQAMRWAERTDDPDLMVLAVLASPHPRRHRRALRRAVALLPRPPKDVDPATVAALVGDDAPALRQLTRWLEPEARARLGLDRAHDGDPEAYDLVTAALQHAVEQRQPRAVLRERALAVQTADPWAVDARLLMLGLDELDAGVLVEDPLLLEDLQGPFVASRSRMARLHLRAKASTAACEGSTPACGSRALGLALAWWLLRADLVGDAYGVLEGLAIPEAHAEATALRAQLQAMTAARRGDVAALEHWRTTVDARSPSLDAWLAGFDEDGRAPALRAAAARARRRHARRSLPLDEDLRMQWAMRLDPGVDAEARARLRHAPWSERGEANAWEAICTQRRRDGATCLASWLHEDIASGLALAGRTRHFHPSFLSDVAELDAAAVAALATLVAAYEGTVLAASPELEATRLRIALATEDYAGARARLESHGALLPAHERSWAWLVIDELEAGATTYDAVMRWLPTYSDEVASEPTGEAEAAAPLRIDRYLQGMAAAAAGRHAEALERLMPVLDALPDAALVDGLARAALAAHLGGDAARRDALRVRLHAVDPHGSAYARMQAKIAMGAAQPAQARRFVAHALRWHPDDDSLHRLMVTLLGEPAGEGASPPSDALALAFVANAAPAGEYRYGPLREQIWRGGVSTLAGLNRLRAGLDGSLEDAWAVEPALASQLSWVAYRAMQWGVQQVKQAHELDEARRWAAATLDHFESIPPRTSYEQHQHVWLALLLGTVDRGLAAARRLDREHGVVPMSEGDTAVLLLQARAAGEVDDALAWDIWRWVHGTDDGAKARMEALLRDPPKGSILQVFACAELTNAEDLAAAFPVCAAAWDAQPGSLSMAVSQSFLALSEPPAAPAEAPTEAPTEAQTDTPDARHTAAAVFRAAVDAPDFVERPGLAVGGNMADPWHYNHALWLGERGEHEAAAWAWWQTYAFGSTGEAGLDQSYAQLRFRGSLVRALQGLDSETGPRELDLRRSMLALAGAEPQVARAYAESAAARVPLELARLDRKERMLPDRLRHLAQWAAGDLAEARLDAAVVGEALELVLRPELPAALALHARYPEASLTRLARLLAHHAQAEHELGLGLAEALLERHPEDPLAVAAALPLLVQAGDDARARALYEAADARHPGDAMLRYADAPESITGPRDGVPAWVRDPARFDARMALVDDADVRGLLPQRKASIERAAELFVPIAWVPDGARALGFIDDHGARMLVLTAPRASRCQGEACASDLLRGIAGQGRTQQWMREVTLAGTSATQALFTNAEEILVAWVVPSGGRVFTVAVAAPIERFDALRPVVVMLRDGFRPLDAVLPPFAAESLRAAGPRLRDGWRFAGRREQARAPVATTRPDTCPVSETLAALTHDHQRAELLVDLWLATAQAAAREALLRCTAPRSASARRLALVALLDEQPRVHAFGRAAVHRHATRVSDDVRTILSTPLTPPVSAPDYLVRSDLPAHGLVEVLGALPLASAGPLVERLLASNDPRDRTLAWAALRLRPALATAAAIDEALAGEPRMVTQAAYLLADRGEPADAQRLRDHLDALRVATTRAARDGLGDVAVALATFLDPRDAARLREAATKVREGDDPQGAARLRETLRQVTHDHERAIALAGDPALVPGPDDGRALRWRNERHQRTLPIRSEAELRTLGLAQVLPGHDWTFARLAAPGLFASTVADVIERLTTGDEAVDQRLGEFTGRVLREGGLAALSQSGGLDTTRPIECAKPAEDAGWLCTAHVTDREALLAVLGQRASGDDAGVSLPLTVATTAGVVPVVLSLLPAILHPLVYPDDPDDDDDDDDGDETVDVEEASERARMELELGDVRLERYSIIDARTRRIGIDSERYLFVGDRLWVFSTEAAMSRALHAQPGPTLADDPEYQRLTAKWQDGAALQAVALGRAWPLAEGGVAMEVVLDEGGLRFRYAGAFESEAGLTDIGPALAQLPPGAVTIFAHGLGRAESLGREPLKAKGSDALRVPPLPVLTEAHGVAFGWYLRDGDHLWRRWLAVAPLDDDLRRALRRAKTPPGRPGASRRHGALCYVERDGYLLTGDCSLVDEAAAGPPAPTTSREQLRVAHAVFDGPAAAERLPGLGGLELEQRAIMRIAAPMLGIVTDMQVKADWIPAERVAVLEGGVALRLRPPGDRTRVIDDWLAASEGHNAATLPRRLRSDEIEAPLRYLIEVPDADAFVRDTLADSPRMKAQVLGPTRVRLVVSPVPATPRVEPLAADRFATLTKSTKELRHDDPRITKLALRLAPAGTTPALAAERIGKWVHERITYEVTPRSLDGVEILEAGRGDCTEYARLTVTLLRAAGVPAEVRDGMAASGDELVAHAWVAYHDGESWNEIDPTWGRAQVSAGHLEMSVLDAIALVSLGKLKIVEIVAAP